MYYFAFLLAALRVIYIRLDVGECSNICSCMCGFVVKQVRVELEPPIPPQVVYYLTLHVCVFAYVSAYVCLIYPICYSQRVCIPHKFVAACFIM